MNKIKTTFLFLLSCCLYHLNGQQAIKIYLFPGQGSDYRIFNKIIIPENCDTIHVKYPIPQKGETMKSYAERFIPLIDTSGNYIFIGVSLGGMICTELTELTSPSKTIIISSAKCRNELPAKYRFQHYIPINKLVPKSIVKIGAIYLQPRVEPDSRNSDLFTTMLSAKDKTYLKRSAGLIVNWQRESYSDTIVHIHGTMDNTIPYENVTADYTIREGSHMMTYTRAEEINIILKKEIKNP